MIKHLFNHFEFIILLFFSPSTEITVFVPFGINAIPFGLKAIPFGTKKVQTILKSEFPFGINSFLFRLYNLISMRYTRGKISLQTPMSAAADIIIIEKEVEHMTQITLPHNHGESADERFLCFLLHRNFRHPQNYSDYSVMKADCVFFGFYVTMKNA